MQLRLSPGRPRARGALCCAAAACLCVVALAAVGAWAFSVAADLAACTAAVGPGADEGDAQRLLDLDEAVEADGDEFRRRVRPVADLSPVPKVVHQIWLESGRGPKVKPAGGPREEMPQAWKNASIWCESLEGYEHVLWTDAGARAFVAQEFPDILPVYDGYPNFVQRVDALRYMILARRGGIYADLDVVCRRSPDVLRAAPAVVFGAAPAGVTNDFLVSRPGHPFFLQVVDGLRAAAGSYGPPYLSVLCSTGTVYLSRQLAGYMRSNGGAEGVRYAWDNFDLRRSTVGAGGVRSEDRILVLSPERYVGDNKLGFIWHTGGSTWHDMDANAIKWIFRHPILAALAAACIAVPLYLRRRRRRGAPLPLPVKAPMPWRPRAGYAGRLAGWCMPEVVWVQALVQPGGYASRETHP